MKRILRWLSIIRAPKSSSPDMMESLIHMLAITEVQEVSCDDVHQVLAEFTEMKQRGEDIAHLMPLIEKHLHLCPDCREEHEALMQALDFEKQLY